MMQQVNHEHYRSTKGARLSDVCHSGGLNRECLVRVSKSCKGSGLSLPLTYRWIQVSRCCRLWLVYPQRYVPVCLGSDLLTSTESTSLSQYSGRKAVLDQRTELLPWQLRVKVEPAVRSTSVWFGKKSELRRIDGGSGGSETKSKSHQWLNNTTNDDNPSWPRPPGIMTKGVLTCEKIKYFNTWVMLLLINFYNICLNVKVKQKGQQLAKPADCQIRGNL